MTSCASPKSQPHCYPIDSTVDRFLRVSSVTRTARRLGRRIILPVRLEGGALRATMHVLDLSFAILARASQGRRIARSRHRVRMCGPYDPRTLSRAARDFLAKD